MKLTDSNRKSLQEYAWPGGYPIMYLARDGWREEDGKLDFNQHDRSENVCCPACAVDTEKWPDLIITCQYIHYEGPAEYCEYCNGLTESAYGDPDEDPEDEEDEDSGIAGADCREGE